MLHVKTAIHSSRTKETKQQYKSQFKHESYWKLTNRKRFQQTFSFCCVMPTSNHNYRCFLILVRSFSACTFSRIVDCFHECKLLSVWYYIFLLNGPDKKLKQNSSKTKQHSQQQEATSVRRRTAKGTCHRNFALIG